MENQQGSSQQMTQIVESQQNINFEEIIHNYKPQYKQMDFSTINQPLQQQDIKSQSTSKPIIQNKKSSQSGKIFTGSKSPQKKSKLYGLLNSWKHDKSARSLSFNENKEEKPQTDLVQSTKHQKSINDITISNFLSQNSLNQSLQFDRKSPLKKKTSAKDNVIYQSHIAAHKKPKNSFKSSQILIKQNNQKKKSVNSINGQDQNFIVNERQKIKGKNDSSCKQKDEQINESDNYKKATQQLTDLVKKQKSKKYENKKVTQMVNKKRPQEQHLFDYKIPKQITYSSSSSYKREFNQSMSLPQREHDQIQINNETQNLNLNRSVSGFNSQKRQKLNRSLTNFNNDYGYGERSISRRNSKNFDQKAVQYTFLSDSSRKILQEKEKKMKEQLQNGEIQIDLIPEKNEEFQEDEEKQNCDNDIQQSDNQQEVKQFYEQLEQINKEKEQNNTVKKCHKKNQNSIWDKLYTDYRKQRQKKQQYVKEKLNMEEQYIHENCTFKPILNDKKKKNSNYAQQQEYCKYQYEEEKYQQNYKNEDQQNQKDIWKRNQEWISKKKEKLQQMQEQYRDMDLQGCTFKPKINDQQAHITYQDQIFKNINTPASQSAFKGIDQYVKRQIIARKNKQEKEFLQNNPYSHLIPAQIKGNSYSLNVTGLRKNPKTTQQMMTIQQQHQQWSQQKEQERIEEERMMQDVQFKRQLKIQQLSQSNCYSDLLQNLHENLHDMSIQ